MTTFTGSSPPAAASQTVKFDAEVPYKSSITFVAAIAFLSPLVAFLWSLHRLINPNNDYYDPNHRQMVEDNVTEDMCDMNETETNGETTAIGSADFEDVWAAISTTSIISASVAFLCLLGYELFRRDPIVGKYVYDRKRLIQPGRTPPSLMTSRSLWDGDENDSRTCCKVRPAILELIFLNLDKLYIRYSHAANKARSEREKRGYYTCCRTGSYHNNCFNRHVLPNSYTAEEFVNEDGYVFYPGYSRDYSHEYHPELKVETDENQAQSPSRGSVLNLFPGDSPRNFSSLKIESFFGEDKNKNGDGFSSKSSEDEQHFMSALGSEGDSARENPNFASPNSSFLSAKSYEEEERHVSFHVEETEGNVGGKLDTKSDNVEWEGELQGGSRCTKEERGKVSFGDQESEGETEGKLDAKSDNVEPEGGLEGESNGTLVKRERDRADCISEQNSLRSNRSARLDKLKYPYRIKYIFMPPGFHTWGNVIDYIGYFFFMPTLSVWVHKIIAKIQHHIPSPTNNDRRSDIRRHRSSLFFEDPGKDLTEGEQELLRCAGLDTYLLVRLARFGFDVTFYPFLFACVTVLPIYYTGNDQARPTNVEYFTLTINRIPEHTEGGPKTIRWILVFTMMLYLYIMRRLWFEWEVFIKQRHSFLAKGDPSFHKNPSDLKKYRNTCMIECVPKSHRSDKKIRDVFEGLFPGQIEFAEMLIDTSELEGKIKKRRKLIEKFDDIDAHYRYECWKYETLQEEGKLTGCCNKKVSKPLVPKVRNGIFSGEKEDALPYYDIKIEKAETSAETIVSEWLEKRHAILLASQENEGDINNTGQFDARHLYALIVPSSVRRYFQKNSEDCYATGIVTFKSVAAKQSAVQCNLSGLPYWMMAADAPDPRDLFWSNIGVEREMMESRKILVQFVLFIGILSWGTFVAFLKEWIEKHSISAKNDEDHPVMSLLVDYLPAFAVSLILLWLPNLFLILAMRVIRFKSHTQCDEFVMIWNTGYRLANIFFILLGSSLFAMLECFRVNPENTVIFVADRIIKQSTFLMNLIILATGQETMLQLLQWRSLIKQAIFRPLINLNKRSMRYQDWLNAAPDMEQSFIFGFFAPVLSYGLMIAMVFAFMVPLMLGVCSVFFWVASKVHMHNALFVYCQRCEGGGTIFYYWNRIVFITLYTSIVVFSGVLLLKKYATEGLVFLPVMMLFTFCVDKMVENTFVIHSLHLPIGVARIHDDEEAVLLANSNTKPDGGENYMYRHPLLNSVNWNSKNSTWS